ncbi:MAG: S8 family serine peptidase [Chloroflexota bacterium]
MRSFLLLFVSLLLVGQSPLAMAQEEPTHITPSALLAPLSPQLEEALKDENAQVSFLVFLNEQLDVNEVLLRAGMQNESRLAKTEKLYEALTTHARIEQQSVLSVIEVNALSYQPFYIVNMIEAEGDQELVDLLRTHPDVDRIELNPSIQQMLSVDEVAASLYEERLNDWLSIFHGPTQATLARPYGLDDTNAPNVWGRGFRGEGITVASQDTGVQWDHAALKASYRGWDEATQTANHVYHWFDMWGSDGRPPSCASHVQIPCDDNGHGSHTVGTMAGDATNDGGTIIGMAPDANWIGCRNMLRGVGKPSSYMGCFEFFLAPYPQDGDKFTDGRPDLSPDIINNSWACPPEEGCDIHSLRQVVETVRSAGLFVISSAGNEGGDCSSVENPIAVYDASFSVGAHSRSGIIANFSSRGPVTADGSGRLKPDLTAPGVSVESAYVQDAYRSLQGTSMASPHVAGAAALLWSAVPELRGNIDLSEQVFIKSAVPTFANQCGEGEVGVTPNTTYGFGRLDVLNAVQLANNPASASVEVLNCDQTPLAGAEVQLIDQYTGYTYSALSDEMGNAALPKLYPSVVQGTSLSQIYTATAVAGEATFAPITNTITAGNQVTMTLEAATCPALSTVTVEVLFGGRPVGAIGEITLVNQQTGHRYSHTIPTNGTTSMAPVALEFVNVLAGGYWIETSSQQIQKVDAPINVTAGSTVPVQLTMTQELYLPVLRTN